MYKCEMRFYITGNSDYFSIIKTIAPLQNFEHIFVDEICAADVIIADLSGAPDEKAALSKLLSEKAPSAQVIIITENAEAFEDFLDSLADIWTAPLSEKALRFRFGAWQKLQKTQRDKQQAEQYLDTLIDSSPSMVWFKSKDGIHEKVNNKFCEIVEKPREDVIGRKHAYIWGVAQDDPGCIASDQKAMQTGETVVSDESVPSQNGMRELISYKTALYDCDGSVMGTCGVAVDVTNERAFRRDIVEKNKMFENVFASIDCGILWHSVDGREIYFINQTALKILGYESCGELMSNGFHYIADSVADNDKERLSTQISSLKNAGDSVNVEYTVRHKDGKVISVLGNIKLVYENGRYFYQRYLLDVTERNRDNAANAHRQAELVKALSATYSVVFYFDLDTQQGEVVYFEENPPKMFRDFVNTNGMENGKLILNQTVKRYCEAFVDEDDKAAVMENISCENLKTELSDGDTFVMNFKAASGYAERYFQIKAVRLGSDVNRFSMVLGIRSVDDEIRREMENKAILETALEQANRANKAKSVFLSNMSHDIRTPMNAIMGFTDVALAHPERTEQVAEYLNKIKFSGRHLLSLINGVLDMSRIESGKMQIDENPCSLTEIIGGLESMVALDTKQKQMKFIVRNEVQNESVICDKLHLNQVLLNLLSNAVKYTQVGGEIAFEVSEAPSLNSEASLYTFVVRDNGAGMSEEFLQHLFEPFEREKNTTVSGIQGTGLGMAITKNLVELMNGKLDVKSRKGDGTEITLKLEFKHCNPTAENADISAARQIEKRSGKILLAEDNELNRELATAILTDLGFEVETAENGKIAVEMLQNKGAEYYGVVLMDVQMPVMNGYEATKLIRAFTDERLRNIPVFAMSANAFEEDKREAAQNGMNGHLSKPIEIDKLTEALDSVFARE